MPFQRPQPARAAAAVLAVALLSSPASAGGVGAGAYCPLPVPGEQPSCLGDARATYGEVFAALDDGEVDDSQLVRLEADVAAGASSENAYLALNSLTYAYYRMAQRAAAAPGEDPVVVARLTRWNRLLAGAFETSAEDEAYREAMLTAALDLQERAPAVSLRCTDARGEMAKCDSTAALLRGYDTATGELGIRGALKRLLERAVGGNGT